MARTAKAGALVDLGKWVAARFARPLVGGHSVEKTLGLEKFVEKPFRIAVLGQTSAGKSALINSIFTKEVSVEKLSADTTDKVYWVNLPNGNELYDTPGTGGNDDYENITRAFMGMAQIKSGRQFDVVPVCRSEDGASCPHIFRRQVKTEDEEHEVVYVPKALPDVGFRKLKRRHEEDPARHPWYPTLCEDTHQCLRFGQESPGSSNADVVLFLFNAGIGVSREVAKAAMDLRTHCKDRGIPLLWAMTYRQGMKERERREALEGIKDWSPRDEKVPTYPFKDVVPVDCKGDPASLEKFVHELVAMVPSANVDAFNRQLKERLRFDRPELLGQRISEAAVTVADVKALRSAEDAMALLVEMKKSLAVHYSIDQSAWKVSSSIHDLEEVAAKRMDLPADKTNEIRQKIEEAEREKVGVSELELKRAREQVLTNFFSQLLNDLFGAWADEVEAAENAIRAKAWAREDAKRNRIDFLKRTAALTESETADAYKVATHAFIYLETLLFWLESKEAREQPSRARTDAFKIAVERLISSRERGIREALQAKDEATAKKLFIEVATNCVEAIRQY